MSSAETLEKFEHVFMLFQDQYKLLHHALHESLATEGFICPPHELQAKMNAHQRQSVDASDPITAEYQVTCKYLIHVDGLLKFHWCE